AVSRSEGGSILSHPVRPARSAGRPRSGPSPSDRAGAVSSRRRPPNSPLTKSLRSDSVPSESEREFGYGDGSAGRSSGRADGDVVRDAALTGPRVLRPPARGAGRSRVRRLRGGHLPSVLRQDHGRTLSPARSVLPHAHGRVLRGDRQRARDRVALFGLAVLTRVPSPGDH